MNNDVIGFKLADGTFYPVFSEGAAVEKQIELTTVRDDQTTIQLHLYKSPSGTMEGARYVETLILENLVPHPKEEPSLSLKIALDDEDNLSAEIIDPETGLSSSTNVSLVTLDEATLHGLEAGTEEFTLNGEDFSFSDSPDDGGTVAATDIADLTVTDDMPVSDSDLLFDDMPTMSDFDIDLPVSDFNLPEDTDSALDFSLPTDEVQEESFDIDFSNIDMGVESSEEPFRYDDIPDFGVIPEENNLDNPIAGTFSTDDDFYEESIAEERRNQRRIRIPVIICIICAIISVIVLAIILALTPSRLKNEVQCVDDPIPEPVIEIQDPEHELARARENEVVVSPVPVVPELPKKVEPVPEPVAVPDSVAETGTPASVDKVQTVAAPAVQKREPQSVRYKLKWGDTLWDLADTYYRNPWQYKKIARWNGIENPDYIIAGTYIYIPE